MLKRNNTLCSLAFILASLLCASACGAEQEAKNAVTNKSAEEKPAVAESAPADIWGSIESTIKDLADPFVPQGLKTETVPEAPAVLPVVAPPKPPPKPNVVKPAMIPGVVPSANVSATIIPEVPLPTLNLSGVVFDTDTPMAVINDRVYAIGEKLSTGAKADEAVTLKTVHSESVEVDFMGKTHIIHLIEK